MRNTDSPLRTKEEASRYLRVSLRTFYGLVMAGEIRPTVIGDRRKYHVAELDRYIESKTAIVDRAEHSGAAVLATA